MTSSQIYHQVHWNKPVCSDTLMYLSYMRLNLRKKMLHFCRMKYYNFSIIFEMSTTFSMKKPVNLHGQVCRKLRETHRNIKWNSFRLSVPFWISLLWRTARRWLQIAYMLFLHDLIETAQLLKREYNTFLVGKVQNEWLNEKVFCANYKMSGWITKCFHICEHR